MSINLCIKCEVRYIIKKAGIIIEEMASFGSYKIWLGDLKECPKCKHQIIGGFGKSPIHEHYKPLYKAYLKGLKSMNKIYQWKEK